MRRTSGDAGGPDRTGPAVAPHTRRRSMIEKDNAQQRDTFRCESPAHPPARSRRVFPCALPIPNPPSSPPTTPMPPGRRRASAKERKLTEANIRNFIVPRGRANHFAADVHYLQFPIQVFFLLVVRTVFSSLSLYADIFSCDLDMILTNEDDLDRVKLNTHAKHLQP